MERIAVLTSGGDAPGMNAVIRAVVRTALNNKMDIYGVERGYAGLVKGEITRLNHRSVSDMIHKGGTFLKTARCPEFKDIEVQRAAVEALSAYGIDGLVVIGGDGTLRGAKDLSDNFGIKVIGIPGTIDNDLAYTDFTIGFDTAVNSVLWAINNLRDTMHSHDRVSLLEVMGRHCGDIALYAGVAGGAEYVLVPEIPYDLDDIASKIKKSYLRGKTSNMIILAEGAGNRDEIAAYIKEKSGISVKVTNFGYIQRGGSPNMFDRILAARFGYKAVELLRDDKDSCAIGIKDNKVITVPFDEVSKAEKKFDKRLYDIAHVLSL
ncbi:MAG: 6-phosphofructokinase [Clostridia bacterium]|nr:6-phosphofructokinase [Clostridia bacterium]MBQ8427560.1 6-phosphofructokinase [Clostridia bacterium]